MDRREEGKDYELVYDMGDAIIYGVDWLKDGMYEFFRDLYYYYKGLNEQLPKLNA